MKYFFIGIMVGLAVYMIHPVLDLNYWVSALSFDILFVVATTK